MKEMTGSEIRDALDNAATFPGSISLNFGEVGLDTINAWVKLLPFQGEIPTENFDIESIKNMMEEWWRNPPINIIHPGMLP